MQPEPVPGNVSVIPNVLLSALTATKHRRLHLRLQMHQSVVQIPRDDVRKRTPLFFSCFSQRRFVLTCFFLLLLFTIQTWIFPLNYKKGKYIFTHTVISPALSLSLFLYGCIIFWENLKYDCETSPPVSHFQPAGSSSSLSSSSSSISPSRFFIFISLRLSFGATFIWVLPSEGRSVNPNINNEWNGVVATIWPPVCVFECVSTRVCVCGRKREGTWLVGGDDEEQRFAFLHHTLLQSAVAVHVQLEALKHTEIIVRVRDVRRT